MLPPAPLAEHLKRVLARNNSTASLTTPTVKVRAASAIGPASQTGLIAKRGGSGAEVSERLQTPAMNYGVPVKRCSPNGLRFRGPLRR